MALPAATPTKRWSSSQSAKISARDRAYAQSHANDYGGSKKLINDPEYRASIGMTNKNQANRIKSSSGYSSAKKAADRKENLQNQRSKANKSSIKSLKSAGVSDAYLKGLGNKYGSNISANEAAKILNDWNASRGGISAGTNANVGVGLTNTSSDNGYLGPSQRDQASQAYNTTGNVLQDIGNAFSNPFGSTANAATTSPSGAKPQSLMGKAGSALLRGAQVITDPFNVAGKASEALGFNINNPVTDIANALGINQIGRAHV
jgi:hypothetical protein